MTNSVDFPIRNPLQALSVTGGQTPFIFTVANGSLPAGLTLSSGGAISGTPLTSGTSSFTVQVEDANGCRGSLVYTLTIVCPAISLAPPTLPSALPGVAYSQTFTASGGTGPYSFSLASGTPPIGISLSSGGVLSGLTNQAGSFPFEIEVRDAANCPVRLSRVLVVFCPETRIQDLIDLIDQGGLDRGLANALKSRLENAKRQLERGRDCNASINMLGAFKNQVEAQRRKGIPTALADTLIQEADLIIQSLRNACSSCG